LAVEMIRKNLHPVILDSWGGTEYLPGGCRGTCQWISYSTF
jgi:hypothetical protein